MDQRIIDVLSQEEQVDSMVNKLLADSKALVKLSRDRMATYYPEWDRNDQVYRGITMPDKDDKAARERKEPEKMVVPTAFSQTQSFISFCFALYTQRERFFELLGMSEEDHRAAKIGEALLQRDLTTNQFEGKLYQYLLDIARFGIGVIKIPWVKETQRIEVEQQSGGFSFMGINIGGRTSMVEEIVTKFLGNRLINISPYRFFPDIRLPICRAQEGEFMASEDEYSYVSLKQQEKDGQYAGVDHIKQMTKVSLETRGSSRFSSDFRAQDTITGAHSGQTKGNAVITEVQRKIIPSQYMIGDKPLGKEDYPVKWNITYANDTRIIKLEPMNYKHDEFTYSIAEFSPDIHKLINEGLSSTIDQLQSVISWFINSRITSVRKVISNHFIVDPEGVEWTDIKERRPIWRLKPTAGGRGIDRYVKQVDVHDVTTNHIQDAKFLQDLVQQTTGLTDNLLGQFNPGRRSATEARNVNSSAAARIKMIAEIIFRTGIEPMGRQMLSNLRDGLDEETMVRVVGIEPTLGADFIKADKSDLCGNYDFEVFDGTLPSEKGLVANTLQEVLMALMSNPEAAIMLQMDPRAMLLELMELKGVRNPERFTLKPAPQAVPGEQPPPGGPATNGAPQPQMGNLIQNVQRPNAGFATLENGLPPRTPNA